jgi:hypothetical protein
MFVTAPAPNKRSLGAVNSLSQTTLSGACRLCPALSTPLFSLSVEQNLGGHAVYFILFIFSCLALLLAIQLPHKMLKENDASG